MVIARMAEKRILVVIGRRGAASGVAGFNQHTPRVPVCSHLFRGVGVIFGIEDDAAGGEPGEGGGLDP
jgi:hypothetical protein